MSEVVVNNISVNFFDNIMLLSLNEKAYQNGIIDETTKEKIEREIQAKSL